MEPKEGHGYTKVLDCFVLLGESFQLRSKKPGVEW